MRTIDRIDAQTLALTAQGFGEVALDSTISGAVYRLGALQLDFVSRIIRAIIWFWQVEASLIP